jgi:hypothetical protein
LPAQPRARPVFWSRLPDRGCLRPRLEQFEDWTLLANYTASSVKDLINDTNANTTVLTNTITLAANTTFDRAFSVLTRKVFQAFRRSTPKITAKSGLWCLSRWMSQ